MPCFDRFRNKGGVYCWTETKSRQQRKVLSVFMDYYIYGDFYIILNFIMNLFMLMLTAILRQKRCYIGRMLLISVLMAIASMVILLVAWNIRTVQLLLLFVQVGLLTRVSYEYEGRAGWIKDSISFLGLSFLSGGFIQAVLEQFSDTLHGKNRYPMLWVIAAMIFLFLLFLIFRREIAKERQRQKSCVEVIVRHGSREYAIKALYDTGNHLRSPYTGESVAIISRSMADKIQLSEGQNPLLIPYRSIGGSGNLWAYRLDYICVDGGMQRKHMLVAVSDNLSKEIPMILNVEQKKERGVGQENVQKDSTEKR